MGVGRGMSFSPRWGRCFWPQYLMGGGVVVEKSEVGVCIAHVDEPQYSAGYP